MKARSKPLDAQPHPEAAIQPATVDCIGKWMSQVSKEIRHDPGVAALLDRYQDKALGLSTLLSHIPTYLAAMEFFEAIRLGGGKPVSNEILDRLPQIRVVRNLPRPAPKDLQEIQYKHGTYVHYMIKKVKGVPRLFIYVGKGAGGKECLSLAQGERKKPSDVGLRKRVQSHLQEMAAAISGKAPTNTTLHTQDMLHAKRKDIIEERWLFPFALSSTEAIDLVFQLNTSDTSAVLDLYRFQKGTKHTKQHNYGVNQETHDLLDALFLCLEQFTLIAIGQPLGPPPEMLSETRGAHASDDRWDTAPYWDLANALYRQWKKVLENTKTGVEYTNMATPLLDKNFGKLYGRVQDQFDTQYESIRLYSPGLEIANEVSQSPPGFAILPDDTTQLYGWRVLPNLQTMIPAFKAFWKNYIRSGTFVSITVPQDGEFELFSMERPDFSSTYTSLLSALKFHHDRPENQGPFKASNNAPKTIERKITLQFPPRAQECEVFIQITGLDQYGIVHPDLKHVFIWQRARNQEWKQCLARVEEFEDVGEIVMSSNHTNIFKSVAGFIHIISAVLRKYNAFDPQDVAFYTKDYQHPAPDYPAAARQVPNRYQYRILPDQPLEAIRLLHVAGYRPNFTRIPEALDQMGVAFQDVSLRETTPVALPAVNLQSLTHRLDSDSLLTPLARLEFEMVEDSHHQSFSLYRNDCDYQFLCLRPRWVDSDALNFRPAVSAWYQRDDLAFMESDCHVAKFVVLHGSDIKMIAIGRGDAKTPRLSRLSSEHLDAIIEHVVLTAFATEGIAAGEDTLVVSGTSYLMSSSQEAVRNHWRGEHVVAEGRKVQKSVTRAVYAEYRVDTREHL